MIVKTSIGKKYKKILLSLILITVMSNIISAPDNTLTLGWHKEFYRGYLLPDFLKRLKSIFSAKYFIETGTYSGETTEQAMLIFDTVFTVELDRTMYTAAKNKFKSFPHVSVHHGSSPLFLEKILHQIKGSALLFLDAHFSGSGTSRDDGETPILRELEAIKKSKSRDIVILIDDIREFGNSIHGREFKACPGYPTYQEVCKYLHAINPNFQLYLLGDTLLAYDQTRFVVHVSPLISACTYSRAYDSSDENDLSIIEAERIIATAQGQERDVIEHVYRDSVKWNYTQFHGYLWYGLICMHDGNYQEAYKQFNRVRACGYDHWRVYWYQAQATAKLGNHEDAQLLLRTVLEKNGTFQDARNMLTERTS